MLNLLVARLNIRVRVEEDGLEEECQSEIGAPGVKGEAGMRLEESCEANYEVREVRRDTRVRAGSLKSPITDGTETEDVLSLLGGGWEGSLVCEFAIVAAVVVGGEGGGS